MPHFSEFAPGRLAVITGAASGIGFAAARHFVKIGMDVALIDINRNQLDLAVRELSTVSKALGYVADVSDPIAMQNVAHRIQSEMGKISVLYANAGIQPGSHFFSNNETWRRILEVNFWGIANTVNAFMGSLIASEEPTKILITGSKQGITTPPGDPAYNISKAAVKVYTEALAHEMRNTDGSQVSVHLVVPGFVWTPLTYAGRTEKPKGAWTADETVNFIMDSIQRGDFYIICPDNDATRELDEQRIAWAAGDIIANRPPLSRWHKDYAAAFMKFIKE